MQKEKLYPDSGVELKPFMAKHYDTIMNTVSFGMYTRFINRAMQDMNIQEDDQVLDLGCGTGRNAELLRKQLGENGSITGIDISDTMKEQFDNRFAGDKRMQFIEQRIDIPFNLDKKFDKILISFVIHGFPHEIRHQIIKNAKTHLKPGGILNILDFAEFDMNAMPFHHKAVFKFIECKYAFDYIEKDWHSILSEYDFKSFSEKYYMKKYVRLLKVS